MARFGDQELHIGVGDISGQVLVAAGVVQADHHRPDQPCAAQREDIVGSVVQEHGDMGRPLGSSRCAIERRESFGLEEELGMSPRPVAEVKRGAAGVAALPTIASQKGGDVLGGEGNLLEGRGEHHAVDHLSARRRVSVRSAR